MLFLDALAQMKEGKPVRRSSWDVSEGYITIMPDMNYVWKIVTQPNPNAGNFIFSIADFDGDDWVVYEAPKPVVEVAKEAA